MAPDFIFCSISTDGTHIDMIIVDAKSSSALKTEHQVQVAVYILGITEFITAEKVNEKRAEKGLRPLRVLRTGGVWLPDSKSMWTTATWQLQAAPELTDLDVMVVKMAAFLESQLPAVLNAPLDQARWQLVDRCRTCDYVNGCKSLARGQQQSSAAGADSVRTPRVTHVPYMKPADLQWSADMVAKRSKTTVSANSSLTPLRDIENLLHDMTLTAAESSKLRRILDADHVTQSSLTTAGAAAAAAATQQQQLHEPDDNSSHTTMSAALRAAKAERSAQVSTEHLYYLTSRNEQQYATCLSDELKVTAFTWLCAGQIRPPLSAVSQIRGLPGVDQSAHQSRLS